MRAPIDDKWRLGVLGALALAGCGVPADALITLPYQL